MDNRQPRVLVFGGGVAALETIMGLHALLPQPSVATLVAPGEHFAYRPLGVLSPFGQTGPSRFELQRLAAWHGATFVRDALSSVDVDSATAQTRSGGRWPYDELVVATGACMVEAVRGAETYRGERDAARLRGLVDEAGRSGDRIAFVAPEGCGWTLPAFELALLCAAHLRRTGGNARITVATAEPRPLKVFGRAASERLVEELSDAEVELLVGASPENAARGELGLRDGRAIPADHVVSLPKIVGPDIPGLPADDSGFLPVDGRCRVAGTDVHAAGDGTDQAIKQGGIAAQQADVVAAGVAARAGVSFAKPPGPLHLRGLLLTGRGPLFMRRVLDDADPGEISDVPLWWPPDKIHAQRLAPYLATNLSEALPEAGGDIPVAGPQL